MTTKLTLFGLFLGIILFFGSYFLFSFDEFSAGVLLGVGFVLILVFSFLFLQTYFLKEEEML